MAAANGNGNENGIYNLSLNAIESEEFKGDRVKEKELEAILEAQMKMSLSTVFERKKNGQYVIITSYSSKMGLEKSIECEGNSTLVNFGVLKAYSYERYLTLDFDYDPTYVNIIRDLITPDNIQCAMGDFVLNEWADGIEASFILGVHVHNGKVIVKIILKWQ